MTAPTILAIDPGTREFGFACLRGVQLRDWNVKSMRRTSSRADRNRVFRHVFTRLLHETNPAVLVMVQQEFSRDDRLQIRTKVADDVQMLAARHNVSVYAINLPTVKHAVANDRTATKHMLAKAVAARYPELQPYLRGQDWRERYQERMFGAVAVGATYLDLRSSPKLPDYANPQ